MQQFELEQIKWTKRLIRQWFRQLLRTKEKGFKSSKWLNLPHCYVRMYIFFKLSYYPVSALWVGLILTGGLEITYGVGGLVGNFGSLRKYYNRSCLPNSTLFEEQDSAVIRVLFLMYTSAVLLLILSSDNVCPPCSEGSYSPLEWTTFPVGLLKKQGGVPELYLTGRQLMSACWMN